MNGTYHERLVYFATAPRATAKRLAKITDDHIVHYWSGRLRGIFVKPKEGFEYATKEDALNAARLFRQRCRDEAIQKGWLT